MKAYRLTLQAFAWAAGILLGAMVIVVSWLLTWFYVRWANANYDTVLADIDRGGA